MLLYEENVFWAEGDLFSLPLDKIWSNAEQRYDMQF